MSRDVQAAVGIYLVLRLVGESQDTSEWVRDFEMEINLNWEDQLPLKAPAFPGLLTAQVGHSTHSTHSTHTRHTLTHTDTAPQLHRLLALMDVVLEAASETKDGAGGFTKSQVFFSAMRARMRRLPLQFCSKTQVKFEMSLWGILHGGCSRSSSSDDLLTWERRN